MSSINMAIRHVLVLVSCLFTVVAGKTCYEKYYDFGTLSTRYKSKYCYTSYATYSYCCTSGCCYYYNDYYSSGGSIAGAVVGSLVAVGVVVSVIIAIICICRRQQRFAGRVMTPATAQSTVSVVHNAQQGPVMMYPQNQQPQMNPVMSPPPYSPQMQQPAGFVQTPVYPNNQPMAYPYQPATQNTASPIEQTVQTKSSAPFPEPQTENAYECVDQNPYEHLEENRPEHTYGNPGAYQNAAFST